MRNIFLLYSESNTFMSVHAAHRIFLKPSNHYSGDEDLRTMTLMATLINSVQKMNLSRNIWSK